MQLKQQNAGGAPGPEDPHSRHARGGQQRPFAEFETLSCRFPVWRATTGQGKPRGPWNPNPSPKGERDDE